jgi:hypothetical protein
MVAMGPNFNDIVLFVKILEETMDIAYRWVVFAKLFVGAWVYHIRTKFVYIVKKRLWSWMLRTNPERHFHV